CPWTRALRGQLALGSLSLQRSELLRGWCRALRAGLNAPQLVFELLTAFLYPAKLLFEPLRGCCGELRQHGSGRQEDAEQTEDGSHDRTRTKDCPPRRF